METTSTQVVVGDCIVALTTGETPDGQPYIALGGVNCDLEGVEPGLYDLRLHVPDAERERAAEAADIAHAAIEKLRSKA